MIPADTQRHPAGCPDADWCRGNRVCHWRCQDDGIDDAYDDECSNPGGHEFACTGTAYGGDDDSYHGEGRCYCIHCGADGDA